MKPDVGAVYSILRSWALRGGPKSYSDLSAEYQSLTGAWHEPHGSWDSTLGELNSLLATVGAPALSALVILKGANEPGAGFWGCAPNAPRRPKDALDRLTEWNKVVSQIKAYKWPSTIPSGSGKA